MQYTLQYRDLVVMDVLLCSVAANCMQHCIFGHKVGKRNEAATVHGNASGGPLNFFAS